MNVKHNVNYFKKSENLKYIGLGIALVGFIMLWVGFGWTSYILATVGLPTGLVLFFVGSAARSSEADIDECIKRETSGIEVSFEGDRHYEKRVLKQFPPVTVEGYEYDDGLMFKKAKNGKIRSSRYTKAVIYILSDRLYISECRVDLVGAPCEKRIVEIKYENLADTEIKREEKRVSFGKNSYAVKTCRLSVSYGEAESWSAPVNDDVGTDALVEKINTAITLFNQERA
ncbi:MAG: hypothetical protein E7653_03960 [Ruminococcaceae bacterium]|nr:hypothetical protein [Oscillospiraceae bacterium]